jgi:hypothetical protein
LEATASSLDVDESEPNKSSARFCFLSAALTPTGEAFSTAQSLEDFAENFVPHFKGLAKASSLAEVCILEQVNFLPHPHLPEAFFATGAAAAANDFTLHLCPTSLGRG